ncbi:hypothetical protein PVAP13_6NG073603 [Panicum virgatum]|nr:hypothetical protein PVAP13_6NG073603 [Panicum virgatum]
MMRDLLRITLWRQQKERKDLTGSHHQLSDMGPSSYPPPTRATHDTFEANFEDWSRLFSTPNQQADPTFQTPVATGRLVET